MIKAGWKRELCPQCRMPGRVGERSQAAIRARKPDGKSLFIDQSKITPTMFRFQAPPELGFHLNADFCDNCGVFYAYEAVALPDPNPERRTERDCAPTNKSDFTSTWFPPGPIEPLKGVKWACASCFVSEGAIHHPRCKIWPTNTTGPTGPQPKPAEREV